jgi:hypothetical protein
MNYMPEGGARLVMRNATPAEIQAWAWERADRVTCNGCGILFESLADWGRHRCSFSRWITLVHPDGPATYHQVPPRLSPRLEAWLTKHRRHEGDRQIIEITNLGDAEPVYQCPCGVDSRGPDA